jgi:hypothetical protein
LGTPGAVGFFLVALVYKSVFFFSFFLFLGYSVYDQVREVQRSPLFSQ